jgi:hypothetical protein
MNLKINTLFTFRHLYLLIPFVGFCILPFTTTKGVYLPHIEWKWVINYCLIAVTLILFWCDKSLRNLPRLPTYMVYILGVMAIILGFNYFYHSLPFFSYITVEKLGFCALTLFFFNFFQNKNISKLLLLSLTPFLLATFLFLSLGFYLYSTDRSLALAGPFGNMNMATQFVVLSLSVQLTFLTKKSTLNPWAQKALIFLSVYSLTYLYFASSRSALIGAILVIASLTLWRKLTLKRAFIISALTAVTILFAHLFTSPQTRFYEKQPVTKDARLSIYINTVNMITKHPLGVGAHQYEFTSLPFIIKDLFPTYNERHYIRSPHSFPLKVLVQDGIIYGILLALLIYLFLRHFHQKIFISPDFPTLVSISFFIALIPEIIFQFPLENPFPFFAISFFLGLLLACCTQKSIPITNKSKIAAIGIVIPLLFIMTLSTAISMPMAFQGERDLKCAKLACQLNPAYWKGCVNEARIEISRGHKKRALIQLQKVLRASPLNFYALKAVSRIGLQEGGESFAWGCHGFWLFDQIFQSQSKLHETLVRACSPNLLRSFEEKGFEEGYRQFLYQIGIDRAPLPTLKDFGKKIGF